MSKEKKLLFFGELPPNSIHGISSANNINLEMLKSSFAIDVIEERLVFETHDKLVFGKFIDTIKNLGKVISKGINNSYNYFYLVFSLSTFGSFKTLLSIISFRLLNKGKVVLHIHRGDFFSRFYVTKINQVITKLIFKFTHEIIVLSESQKKEIETKFNKPCHVLFNTVELEYKFEKKKKGNNTFIFISNYLIEKGIIDLLDVFKKIIKKYPDLSLQTYGTFSDRNLKEQILTYNSSNIHINETISGIDKFKLISEMDCLILPSWNEGQPVILLEAMSLGTPVIATKVGLVPELLGLDYPYLAEAKDKISLEKSIIRFLDSKDNLTLSKKLEGMYNASYSNLQHALELQKIFK